MNGYKIMADSYRLAAEQGKISKEQADQNCRLFDFLASCSKSDIYTLADSGAFDEIARAYMQEAVKQLVNEGTITEEQGQAVRNRFAALYDEMAAEQVCKD